MSDDTTGSLGDWPPGDLRAAGGALLDRLAAHFESLDTQRVRPEDLSEQRIAAPFRGRLPDRGTEFGELLERTWRDVVPGLTQWNHPGHHAYFSNSSSAVAMLGELFTAAFNVNVMVWESAPAAAAVERQTLDWLADLCGLDWPGADSVLVDGASLATCYALCAARDRLGGHNWREHGASGAPRLRVYCTDQTHSSVAKAAIALGIGTHNLVQLQADDGVLSPHRLLGAVLADKARGFTPLAVVANLGTTNVAAIDPIGEIAEVCRAEDVWLHVDAAYGGFWRIVPSVAEALPSLAAADSVVANPHKVLFCPMEASALFVRHPGALRETFSLVPEYLRTATGEDRLDHMNYSLQLGRQFRALKVWWVLQSFGREGLRSRLEHAVLLARSLAAKVDEHPRWRQAHHSLLPLVTMVYDDPALGADDGDRVAAEVHRLVNAEGSSAVSHTRYQGRYALRVSIGNIHTARRHVESLWDSIRRAEKTALEGAGHGRDDN
ncbi:pyridoxal-dependent decarboxylase [Amycolatopsis sp. OK19-0408]|uniref:Pyridoxal-dependent decarboxylase n=1 Tax=Amycolatopsis iheyensis TaxID=2945988 RepID=A0A9X2N5R2_9PSEU|nr:pyridoxal-dependent decarboxylase [Amycolatopsis iheyensis]MCR6482806.1 pyridoxal-dependent decarboxylase [Amycolatopsis iheyensis]